MGNRKRKISFSIDRLEYVLREKKIQHKTICEKVGCSYENYKQWRRDSKIVKDDLAVIANFINIDFDWLLGYEYLSKTKDPPSTDDYVRDPDGYIIPPYKKQTMYDINQKRRSSEMIFQEWLDTTPLYEFVNMDLTANGNAPLQKKEFLQYFEIFSVTLSDDAFSAVVEAMSNYIIRGRKIRERRSEK